MLLINNNLTPTFATSNMEDVKHPASEGVFNLLTMTTAIVPYSKKVPLSQGKEAIVGYWWHSWVSQWKWYAMNRRGKYYAVRGHWNGKNMDKILLHRVILGVRNTLEYADHINMDSLNNTECNLRKSTPSQNQANKLPKNKYKGVSKHKASNKWYAQIRFNNKHYNIGLFDSPIDAAFAYNNKALELQGEFAYINKI